jgi:hypothetical protein
MCISLLIFENLDQQLHQIWLLQHITSTKTLVSESIDKRHRILNNFSILRCEQPIKNFLWLVLSFFIAVKKIIVHITMNDLSLDLLLSCLGQSPSESLKGCTDLKVFVGGQQELLHVHVVKSYEGSQSSLLLLLKYLLILAELLLLQNVLLLLDVLLLLLLHLHVDASILIELVLELLLNRVDLVVKGVVSPINGRVHQLLISVELLALNLSSNHHLLLWLSTSTLHLLLLDNRLDVGWLGVQIDAVLGLEVLYVVI